MDVKAGLQTFARGGCFLPDTKIKTPHGDVEIQHLSPGDEVYSWNEFAHMMEISHVSQIVTLNIEGYSLINKELQVTATHPIYTSQGMRTAGELKVGDKLFNSLGEQVGITSIDRFDHVVQVYNLIGVIPNHNYFADDFLVHNKGGSCFLSGTKITLSNGKKRSIEKIKPQDIVLSLNERTDKQEYATVETVQISKSDGYYIINDDLKVTGTHPIYIDNELTHEYRLVEVQSLKIGDKMASDIGWRTIQSIKYVDTRVTVYNLINVVPNHNYYANDILVHNKGGFSSHSSSSSRSTSRSSTKSSSTSSKTSTRSTTTTKKTSTSTQPKSTPTIRTSSKAGTSKAKPGSTIKTADGKTIKSSTVRPADHRFNRSVGVVGDNGYQPRFTNGYTAPAGSVIYYQNHDFLDYLPWIYLFSQTSSPAPQYQQAAIVQPNGQTVTAKPESSGVDGLTIINWILLILIVTAIIGGIVWLVNKMTDKA